MLDSSTSAVITDDDREKAKSAKEQGNEAFKEKRYNEAVRLYTEAIGKFASIDFKFKDRS